MCPAVYTDVTTIVRCYDQDKTEVLCSSASDNTILQVECAAYYELSDRLGVIRYCKNGNWNLPPPKCIPGQPIVIIQINVNVSPNCTNNCSVSVDKFTNDYLNISDIIFYPID